MRATLASSAAGLPSRVGEEPCAWSDATHDANAPQTASPSRPGDGRVSSADVSTLTKLGVRQAAYQSGAVRLPGRRGAARSEERRVGKECRSRWSPEQ